MNTYIAQPTRDQKCLIHGTLFIIFLLIVLDPSGSAIAQDTGFSMHPSRSDLLKSLTPDQVQKGKEILQEKEGKSGLTASQPSALKKKENVIKSENPSPSSSEAGNPPPEKRTLSPFEAYIQGKTTQAISLNIRQFGYDLFENPPTTFAPADTVPVGPDYLLGPGDELRINIWGKLNLEHAFILDRDGKASLPQVGTIHLAGLTFSEAKEFIRKEFGRYYKPAEVKINISMGRLRSIRVFVVGKAERPGSYTLSSFSTLINALFSAGGPSKIGTMRDIQVKRKGKTITHFDLYDFLLKGDKENDIRLMPEDVIFIPTVGPRVGLSGHVKFPAIYELQEETPLRDLIGIAGGIMATGYLKQVQIERVIGNEEKQVIDINLKSLPKQEEIALKDGDLVKVFSVPEKIKNPLELVGNLVRPGLYQWTPGRRVGDLIRGMDDLLPDTYLEFALIERQAPPDRHKEYLSFGLGKLLLVGDERENVLLAPDDIIIVFNRKDLLARENVRIEGAVNQPGTFEYRPNMTLSDLLRLAGGLKRETFSGNAKMTRITPTPEGPRIEEISVDPKKALEGDPEYDLPLQEDDYLFVRTVPEWELYKTVHIEGEVRFPGTYTRKKGETLSSLIKRAGDFTQDAYLKGAVFTRESVRQLQQRQLDEAIDRLEHQLISQSANTIETSLSPDALLQEKTAAGQRKSLIAKLRTAKARGRIAIHLEALEKFQDSPSDLILEEGDRLIIPEKPQQVQIIGSVYNQSAFIFNANEDVSDYLEKAGGMTENAEEKALYILKIDGSALSRQQGKSWGRDDLMSSSLDPGDTIVVPEKLEKIAWLREARDLTQILFQIATTAGILIVAF